MITDEAFPVDPWHVRETQLDLNLLAQSESLFTLSNGHIGLRGNLDEGEPYGLPGTYLNSFYEIRPLPYAEAGYGYPEAGQTLVDVTNGKIIRLLVEDEPFDVRYGELISHERDLDLRAGTLTRTAHWRSPAGKEVKVVTTRLVSLPHRGLAAIEYVVEAVGEFVRVTVQSELVTNEDQPQTSGDPRVSAILENPLEEVAHENTDTGAVLMHRTRSSALMMAAGMDHEVEVPGRVEVSTDARADLARTTVICGLREGQKLRIVKYLAYGWSSMRSRPALRDQVAAALHGGRYSGWQGLLDSQRKYLDNFWDCADVEVEGDPESQQAVRFGLFHLLQASARAERRAIAAKGLTGTGYDGHAFWDTEGYVLPVLTYTAPHTVADALKWRASTLDLAKERAAELGLEGAAFPWRTIRGQECSAYWPAGTAAWHINADIAMAFERYRIVTGDDELEADCGLKVLVETARLWLSLGHHDRHGVWHLDGVTGPDEYTAVVRDNAFTNLMAAHNLHTAADACNRHPDAAKALGVTTEEAAAWRDAADAAHIPYDDGLGVHQQCEGFTTYAEWDFEKNTTYPLLLHEAYVRLYPAQVIKQADLVLAMHWQSHAFTPEQKARNVDYYEPRMVRDSAVGLHPGGDVRRGRASGAGARLRLRGRPDRPARPAPQHPRRPAHGLARRRLDRAGGRVRRTARRRGRAVTGSRATGRDFAVAIPAAVARLPGHHRRQPRRRHVHAARRARRRADDPARRRGPRAEHRIAHDGRRASPQAAPAAAAAAAGARAHAPAGAVAASLSVGGPEHPLHFGAHRGAQFGVGQLFDPGRRAQDRREQPPTKLQGKGIGDGEPRLDLVVVERPHPVEQGGDVGEALLQLARRIAVEHGAGHHPHLAVQGALHYLGGGVGLQLGAQVVPQVVEHGADELFLGAEVPENQPVVDACPRGDVADGGRRRAALGEQLGGGLQDRRGHFRPPGRGFPAASCGRCSHLTTLPNVVT